MKVQFPTIVGTACMLSICLAGMPDSAHAATLITDDFEVDSSADYTVVDDGTPDGTATFAFDYVAAGIPLAPNSQPGDTGGLRFTANDTAGASDAITAFHNSAVPNDRRVTLMVDVYMGVEGTGGTTEYANIGLGSDGSVPNSVFLPISGSGTFMSMTGDGGSSTSDYRYFVETQTTTNSGDPSYLAGSGNAQGNALYESIFPGPLEGSPTNVWTTVMIEWIDGRIIYSLDGTPIFDTDLIDPLLIDFNMPSIAGFASLGYADVFSSVASPFQSQFGIYDNLKVTAVPEPASAALLMLSAVGFLRRRR